MCKNLIIVGLKPDKQKAMNEFLFAMSPIMSENDKDGLGYVMMNDDGLYGERWLNPKDAWRNRKIWTKRDQTIADEYKGNLVGNASYNCFAEANVDENKPAFAVMMHARMATCEKTLKNVHPFVRNGAALIHNGVINNVSELKQLSSTCDSECILNEYVDKGVNKSPDSIAEVGKTLRGSYTCGVLTKNEDGLAILDLFRSSPLLHSCYIPNLDAIVFCTSKNMVEEACKELKWKTGNFFELKDDNMVRINARTGRFLSSHRFQSTSWASTYPKYDYEHNQWDNYVPAYKHHSHYAKSPVSTTSSVQETIEEERATTEKKSLPIVTSSFQPKLQEKSLIKTTGMKKIFSECSEEEREQWETMLYGNTKH